MKYLAKIKAILVVGLILVGSCTKDFEEMNIDPNEPSDVQADVLLTYVLRQISEDLYNVTYDGEYTSSMAGHITKIQYIDEARYEYRPGHISGMWSSLYTRISDLNKLLIKAQANENPDLEAVALTLRAFEWQKVTDVWRDVPYTEGVRGEEGITNPAYDTQDVIYNGIISDLETAANLFDPGALGASVGTGDIVYDGDILKWQKFCNSMRLRVAIRISYIDATRAQSIIESILGNPASYPIMTSNADNFQLKWTTASPYREPFFENYLYGGGDRDDHACAKAIVDTLLNYNDPRLPEYAHPAVSDGQYRGIVSGIKSEDEGFELSTISRIGYRYRDQADGYTYWMRYPEIQFIIAEAAQRGWATGTTAQAAYEAGITASLEEHGATAGEITTYLSEPEVDFTTGNELTKIWIQKWISLFKQGFEAWAEIRRTDVPFRPAAPGSFYPGHNRCPFRMLYPDEEVKLNKANHDMFKDNIVDAFWGQQMWWDTRTGVN